MRGITWHRGLSQSNRVLTRHQSAILISDPSLLHLRTVHCRTMAALRHTASRLQPALSGRFDSIVPAAAGLLQLVRDLTQPADALAVRGQQRQRHGSAVASFSTATHRSSSTPDPRSVLQPCWTAQHGACCGIAMVAQLGAYGGASPVRRTSQQNSHSFSAAAAQASPCRAAGRQSDAAFPLHAVQSAGYSSSAAFVSEHGGGCFRTTAVGSKNGGAHGARLDISN